MIIRQAKESDFDNIYELVKAAFETAKVADGDEQEYVYKLRESKEYIAELELVAEIGDKLIGHIMFTKMYIETGQGQLEALLLSPLCVGLEHRNKGIGGQLIKEGFNIAVKLGYTAVFLAGDPLYYNKFGFKPSIDFGISNTQGYPDENVLVCELIGGALSDKKGTIKYIS